MRVWLAVALLGGACRGGGDCAALDPVASENCRFEKASALFLVSDPTWRDHLAAVPSAASRDLLRLRLAILDPQQGPALCAGVETEPARDRCRQVLGRPHLASPPELEPPP